MLESRNSLLSETPDLSAVSAQATDVEQLVRSKFSVKEFFALPGGELEFQIGYDRDTSKKFAELLLEAGASGFRPELSGSHEECVLILRKVVPSAMKKSRMPVLLALLTLASLAVFGLLQESVDAQLVPSMSPYFIFFGFSGTIAVLMAAHEVGQRFMSRGGHAGRSNRYLIPGVPFFTPFLPSLGFVSTQNEAALNRNRLFDAVVAGPLTLLCLSIALYVVGAVTAVQSAVPFPSTQLVNSTISINPSAIQIGINSVLGSLVPSPQVGYVEVSPIADGAAFGFILAFIGFLPMALFDGGLLSSIAWGEKAARAATYLSVLILLMMDMEYATYWAVAIVALLLAGRPIRLKFLDEVSPLSSSRRWFLAGILVLAFLCVPITHSLATIQLP